MFLPLFLKQRKKCYSHSFSIYKDWYSTRALQSTPFQNLGGVGSPERDGIGKKSLYLLFHKAFKLGHTYLTACTNMAMSLISFSILTDTWETHLSSARYLTPFLLHFHQRGNVPPTVTPEKCLWSNIALCLRELPKTEGSI